MSANKELTFQEIAEHNTKKDLYLIVHDKVYDCTSFVDEHPGGEEVLLDVGGQDSTEAFEDVGHSDEAREILDGLYVGDLKRMPGDPAPKAHAQPAASSGSSDSSGLGVGLYAFVLVGGAIAYGAYQYLQQSAVAEGQ
ncbi:cytochrome b5-like heme/steroid binding domain-containing protein [Aspergillus affinis]|uniref:cytochrome b5-like heme/steroid binding domain-containing protein n=1 Tax=Aspergillus affinis TaxID=1070780 RepID=UPI0022FF0F4C|nr:putative cytochrome b5 [Aspergillus affinis]KAI9046341.1 putative cytochrome b5 [Aspergillus affinis]